MGSSLNQAELNAYNAKWVAGNIIDDTPVAIRLKKLGTGTVTSVTVTTGTGIVMITSDGGTDSYTFAAYTTFGTLVDAINADGIFEAKILDGLRADASVSVLVNGAITISAAGYYDAKVDTDAQKTFTYRATYDREVGNDKLVKGHRVKLAEVLYNVNINAASAQGFRIYEWNADAKTETLIYTRASVDATNTTINFAAGNGFITAGVGNDLIVRVIDGTSITDATANFMDVSYVAE